MEITGDFLNGAKLLKPSVFEDSRGYFFESYNKKTFELLGIKTDFVQDNESCSCHGVLRGLHFQKPPYTQAKLISVLEGEIEDIIVDLRLGSPTFGQYYKTILSSKNMLSLYVPHGFAHGFLVLSEGARVSYKCDNFYNPLAESGIKFNDAELNITWSLDGLEPVISAKDTSLKSFAEYKKEPVFKYE